MAGRGRRRPVACAIGRSAVAARCGHPVARSRGGAPLPAHPAARAACNGGGGLSGSHGPHRGLPVRAGQGGEPRVRGAAAGGGARMAPRQPRPLRARAAVRVCAWLSSAAGQEAARLAWATEHLARFGSARLGPLTPSHHSPPRPPAASPSLPNRTAARRAPRLTSPSCTSFALAPATSASPARGAGTLTWRLQAPPSQKRRWRCWPKAAFAALRCAASRAPSPPRPLAAPAMLVLRALDVSGCALTAAAVESLTSLLPVRGRGAV